MFRNYLLVSLRNLIEHKLYSIANIFGLALGVSFFTLLFLLIRYELSFDTMHEKADRIFRGTVFIEQDELLLHAATTPMGMGPAIQKQFPEFIEEVVRVFNFQSSSHGLECDGENYNERFFYFVDSTFFDVFDFPLVLGEPESVLSYPGSVVISERVAEKYFKDKNPIGQIIFYQGNIELVVTGVVAAGSQPSHFVFDFLCPLSTLAQIKENPVGKEWPYNTGWTYFLLKEQGVSQAFESAVMSLMGSNRSGTQFGFQLQPIKSIHLYSNLGYEISINSDINYIYLFGTIAVLILLITTINFTNLSTARSSLRAKEIGIRKAIGADESELLEQFLLDSFFISLIAIFFSFALIELLLPILGDISEHKFDISNVNKFVLVASVFGSGLLIGFLASIYPSYYLSRFQPSEVLSGTLAMGVRSQFLRSILVIVQFGLTIFLIITSIVVFRQLIFLRDAELGFEKDQIIMVQLGDNTAKMQYTNLKASLEKSEFVEKVTAVDEKVGVSFQVDGFTVFIDSGNIKNTYFPTLIVREDFFETFGIEMIAGTPLLEDRDSIRAIVVNGALLDFLGFKDAQTALGKKVTQREVTYQITGVVGNFNFNSLRDTIGPLVIRRGTNANEILSQTRYMAIKSNSQQLTMLIEELGSTWEQYFPGKQPDYFFLREHLGWQYHEELKLGKISFYFALAAIFIACLGLFSLTSFTVDQRKKEVAIRKAIGTTTFEVIRLLSNEFFVLVLLAVLISWPASYFALDVWLSRYPFRVDIGFLPFFTSAAIAFLVTIITVSYHTIRAALRNPVEDLQI